MTVEDIRYRIPAERAAEFEAAYADAAKALAATPECVGYELIRGIDEPDQYVFRATWNAPKPHARTTQSEDYLQGYEGDITDRRTYEPTAVRGDGGAVPTLYEWLGGADALLRLTEAFYREVLKDDLLHPLFAGMDPEHPQHVAVWLGEVFGGPSDYTGSHGGYRHMIRQHLGRGIQEKQRRRWVSLLMDAADEVGLPDDPEFRAAFTSYIEWGTRLAVINSRPGVKEYDAPMPKWHWGGHPPYRG
ncbi:hemoglobin [Catenulispora sp. GP43]|uniref:group II truncated hemoglobin n=1 Tax=Catenulispora sp. GP43 TaxID=3156263 RepID=UPI003511C0C7